MSESLHWVMASSRVANVDDGSGRKLSFSVYDGQAESSEYPGWRWIASAEGRGSAARGMGYPDPISARAAAEYWLSVTREQNALRAALEAEGQS